MPRDLHIEPVVAAAGEGAVDDVDDDDLDDGLVALQRSISNKRREGASNASPIQKVLPFPFAPNVRPLTISDVDSCVSLENAAFSNKQHRASRDKVGRLVLLFCFFFPVSPTNVQRPSRATTHCPPFRLTPPPWP